ncbi:hypothetical protein V6N11_068901 [Hibiscus sabdariffa]|uniref:Movement protein BL1 n=1 Tax=Hibiscus sabdariffa TaxID=183260 RepID=A0ABR2PBI1_9ROSI
MDSRLSNAQGSMFNYIESNREEYKLSNDLNEIVLTFPLITEQAWARARGRCMKIDHCVIEYRQQVPMNVAGTVIVEVHDTSLNTDESLQATFTFPIRCNIDLHYFSSSFCSVKDPNPWGLYYRVEESNVINETHFAKFKARLKMSTVKHSVDVVFKRQTVKIRLEQRPRLPELRPGETWATRSTIGTDVDNESTINDKNYPYSTLHGLQPSMLDPGQSASVVGAERTQSNITISRNEL